MKRQRLTTPMVKDEQGNLKACSWEEALIAVATQMNGLSGDQLAAVVGDMIDAEALVALKDLLNRCGSEGLYTEEGFPTDGSSG